MGQFLEYIASVFSATDRVEQNKASNHGANKVVSPEKRSKLEKEMENERMSELATKINHKNSITIKIYSIVALVAVGFQFWKVTLPKMQVQEYDMSDPDVWQHVTLSAIPLIFYAASIGAMYEINKPIGEDVKLSAKNTGLDLNRNDFIYSLKLLIMLIAICQISSAIFSVQLLWSIVMIIPFWCYQLTTRVAQTEYERYAPNQESSSKRWVRLNLPRSPLKPKTPRKKPAEEQSPSKRETSQPQVQATPRTRTRRAVKNIISGVSDKYHAFEQNAQQFSQKLFTPLSPKLKSIENQQSTE